MTQPTLNIIGAGNLGKTIGFLLVKNQVAKICAVQNTSEESALSAIDFIGEGQYFKDYSQVLDATLTLITTPDDCIAETCLQYSSYFKPGSIVLHCSGSLTSDELSSAKNKGCYVASVHPMHSFAKPEMSILHYDGTFAALEGDEEALQIVSSIFEAIGSITYPIKKEKKSLYHAAGVFASNYLVTLSKQAFLCLEEAGVESTIARKIVTQLMKGTVNNLEKNAAPEEALTGPIQRGDLTTISNHLTALSYNNEQKDLYSILGKATLQMASHNKIRKKMIEDIFNLSAPNSGIHNN